MDRMTGRQKVAVDDYVTQQSETMKKRQEATESLETLTETQGDLKTAKATVQRKLADARELLSKLTAEEKARLAAIEREKQQEAARKAAELARQQAAQQKAQEEAAQQQDSGSSSAGSGSSSSTAPADSSYATKAEKALAFARAQIGKPYVWGAVGPGSYDCSGLTQAAWKAAGVTLPRTTYDQVNAGTTVPLADAQPGDLVFFYDDVTHVGIYIGNGMMIHAPKPGTYVREESIYYDGESAINSVVRPA
jgi:cell wall-associated NlpC family hydrolase